jgi:isopentenyl phosphate kinase
LILLKLGGSLITDKQVENAYRADTMERIAVEIAQALAQDLSLQLILGHGSGSFGHFAAKKHHTVHSVATPEGWRGFAEVAAAAAELNHLVLRSLRRQGVPAMKFQPSASAQVENGQLLTLATLPIQLAVKNGIVPLVHGDVAFDSVRGGTIISTETIFFLLAQKLPVKRVILLGEVEGVYDQRGVVIPEITPQSLSSVEAMLGGSSGVDVTGGMETKVRDMVALVQHVPDLTIQIADGRHEGLITRILLGESSGTTIHQGEGTD